MISKSQISFVKSLQQKKIRREYDLFVVEGVKSILEFLHSDYKIDTIFYTENVVPKLGNLLHNVKLIEIKQSELARMSTLSTPQQALALVKMPKNRSLTPKHLKGSFTLVLDGVQDPGNLGTIIRTADWFDMKRVICSEDTVDAYNPKVVQATMGSLSRIEVLYTDIEAFIDQVECPVYGALLNGEPIYNTKFGAEGVIILGNEGNGISHKMVDRITYPVTIPKFGGAESLNVAISAAIFCSEIRRNSQN